jgi:hypothetical protein
MCNKSKSVLYNPLGNRKAKASTKPNPAFAKATCPKGPNERIAPEKKTRKIDIHGRESVDIDHPKLVVVGERGFDLPPKIVPDVSSLLSYMMSPRARRLGVAPPLGEGEAEGLRGPPDAKGWEAAAEPELEAEEPGEAWDSVSAPAVVVDVAPDGVTDDAWPCELEPTPCWPEELLLLLLVAELLCFLPCVPPTTPPTMAPMTTSTMMAMPIMLRRVRYHGTFATTVSWPVNAAASLRA